MRFDIPESKYVCWMMGQVCARAPYLGLGFFYFLSGDLDRTYAALPFDSFLDVSQEVPTISALPLTSNMSRNTPSHSALVSLGRRCPDSQVLLG